MPQIVHNPDALPTFPVFSQATISKGHVFVSGNIGCKADLKTLVEGGVQAQTVSSCRIPVPFVFRAAYGHRKFRVWHVLMPVPHCITPFRAESSPRKHQQGPQRGRVGVAAHRQGERLPHGHEELWAHERGVRRGELQLGHDVALASQHGCCVALPLWSRPSQSLRS